MRRRFEDREKLGLYAVIATIEDPNANLLAGDRSIDVNRFAAGLGIRLARESEIADHNVEGRARHGGDGRRGGETSRRVRAPVPARRLRSSANPGAHLMRAKRYALGRGFVISFWASLPTNWEAFDAFSAMRAAVSAHIFLSAGDLRPMAPRA